MLGISEFFKRIQNIHTQEILIRGLISEAIQKHVGVQISPESIQLKGSTVILKNVPHALKSTLFIKKATVLEELGKTVTYRKITDIK